ncbi:MAG: EAL domain-containing protein [Sulfuricaulis sp.]
MLRQADITGIAGTGSNQALNLIQNLIQVMSNGKAGADFKGCHLSSAFQPVFSIAHRRPVGYEALLRARNAEGGTVSPLQMFGMAEAGQEMTQLDRLSRSLHVHNYQATATDNSWLFLNINPDVVVHGKNYGKFFAEMLDHYAFPAHRIVVEILEGTIRDESLLTEAVEYYRRLGCLVAIDDFGAGHSNFERIWRVAPDIVKLDRSVIVQATTKNRVRRVLPSLVSLLHEAGCLVLMEGVETQEEALISMDADVDFVQGYYFGRPAASLDPTTDNKCVLNMLCDEFKMKVMADVRAQRVGTEVYMTGFMHCAEALQKGVPLERACHGYLTKGGIERCYLLSVDGMQLGANQTSPLRSTMTDRRFSILEDANGARWFRRTYFRRALAQPGQVQMSRPYLSLTGAHMCVTLSIAMEINGETRVLCSDLNWEIMVSRTGGLQASQC